MKLKIVTILLAVIVSTSLAFAEGEVGSDYKMKIINPKLVFGDSYLRVRNYRAGVQLGGFTNSSGTSGLHSNLGLEYKTAIWGWNNNHKEGSHGLIYINPGIDLDVNYDTKKEQVENINLEATGLGLIRIQGIGFHNSSSWRGETPSLFENKPYGTIEFILAPTSYVYKKDRKLGLEKKGVRLNAFIFSGHDTFSLNGVPLDILASIAPIAAEFGVIKVSKTNNLGENSAISLDEKKAGAFSGGTIGAGIGHVDDYGRVGYEFNADYTEKTRDEDGTKNTVIGINLEHQVSYQIATGDDLILELQYANRDKRISTRTQKRMGQEPDVITKSFVSNHEQVLSVGLQF